MRIYTLSYDANLDFITSKGFDIKLFGSLNEALQWVRTTFGDNLMYGEPTGDDFDKMVGEMRRPMLIESVERAIKNLSSS